MKFLITGLPGSGKTTLCKKVYEAFCNKIRIGGIITHEIRKQKRLGFKIKDLLTGKEEILAHVEFKGERRIGRYGVNLEALEKLGLIALENARNCDLIIIDEIGPMELLSARFSAKVYEIFLEKRNILATIHFRARHRVRSLEDVELYFIDVKNRNQLAAEIIEKFGRLFDESQDTGI